MIRGPELVITFVLSLGYHYPITPPIEGGAQKSREFYLRVLGNEQNDRTNSAVSPSGCDSDVL
jgi:hypothetical protein